MLGPDLLAPTAVVILISISWIILVVWILPLSPIVRDKGLDGDEYDIFEEPLPFVYKYVLPMMLYLIRKQHGETLAAEISDQFIHDRI